MNKAYTTQSKHTHSAHSTPELRPPVEYIYRICRHVSFHLGNRRSHGMKSNPFQLYFSLPKLNTIPLFDIICYLIRILFGIGNTKFTVGVGCCRNRQHNFGASPDNWQYTRANDAAECHRLCECYAAHWLLRISNNNNNKLSRHRINL